MIDPREIFDFGLWNTLRRNLPVDRLNLPNDIYGTFSELFRTIGSDFVIR